MKTRGNDRTESVIEDEAATWICEREAGFSPEQARAFAAWCLLDPRHVAAVSRVERTLALLDDMPEVQAPLMARVAVSSSAGGIKRAGVVRFPVRYWVTGVAAALVVGIVGWTVNAHRGYKPEQYASEGASQRRVTLADGSLVDLNAGTRITVAFVEGERRVTLWTGEAHFQVSPDVNRPFIVSAGGVSVRAVGTAFNVQLASSEVAVLVTAGKVQVRREPAPAASTESLVASEPAYLIARERTVVPMSSSAPQTPPAVEQVSAFTLRSLLAWKNSVSTFVDVPLREVVAQFNRRNLVQLELADAGLGERKIGGVIALDDVEAFVRLLGQDGDIVGSPRGGHTIVLRRAR